MPGAVHEADVCLCGTVVRLGECFLQAAFLKIVECGVGTSQSGSLAKVTNVLSPGQAA